jgi:hypothetical protein
MYSTIINKLKIIQQPSELFIKILRHIGYYLTTFSHIYIIRLNTDRHRLTLSYLLIKGGHKIVISLTVTVNR